tara:strand:- start:856 stop:1692 length:837 start_codon:yes stop_codon:yes gene_type:complete
VKIFILTVCVFLNISCATKNFILNQTEVVSHYFDRKLKRLDNQENLNINQKRDIIQTKIEYAYGILMEKGDMLLDNDYHKSLKYYQKSNIIFKEAKHSSMNLLSARYPKFEEWLKNQYDITFCEEDIQDLYWLAAALGGIIQSSRGSDPFALVHIPTIGKLLETAINLNQEWGNGKLYSAMMSYTTVRPDLNRDVLDDSLNFYFEKAVKYSDSLDASIFLSYAESVHKPKQEKKEYIEKLNFVIEMDLEKGSQNEISNIISKRRARWLLSKTEDYFLE